jgi:hypothetical protein
MSGKDNGITAENAKTTKFEKNFSVPFAFFAVKSLYLSK